MTTLEYSPYGVIGAITPTTNPTETIICNTVGMLAAGNTVVFSPHPRARHLSAWLVDVLNRAMVEAGLPTTSSLSSLSRLQTPPKLSSTTPTSRCL
ncbi:CoA-acylating propionaldehyde dehydrogenase [Cutibacterium acnes JCM 18918]|nr:CoA-acylating propionaldehyde dehydrogenase [Cutibacterium acnes JCM 18918]